MGEKHNPAIGKGRKRLPLLLFAFSFFFFAFVMWCAPYSSDDLEFAALAFDGIDGYLNYILQYGNGRFLGNAGAILMVKSRVLCILAKSLILSSCVVLIPSVLGIRSTCGYLLSFVLFVMIEPAVFGEVYVWTSGFNNYVPPIWLSLVMVYLIQRYPNVKNSVVKLLLCIGIFLLGAASQLFIEHSSGVNVLLAFCFVVKSVKSEGKRAVVPSVIWQVATLAGLALMLLIPRIFYVAGNHTESYRSLNLGNIAELVYSCAKNMIQLSSHYFGACQIPICFGAAASVYLTRQRRSEKANTVLYALSTVSLLYLLLSMFLSVAGYLGKAAVIQHAIDCVFVVLPFAVWVLAALKLEPGAVRNRVLFCLAFALISVAPLLIVTPIPTRVIYQSYVFVLLAALVCYVEIEKRMGEKLMRCVKTVAFTASVLLVLIISSVFLCVHSMVQVRDRHIRQEIASGATEIVIFQLPYDYTTWDHLWSQQYLYDLEQPIAFSSIDFDIWMNDIYK